uniref:(northern house mosquito) hypothetical protein n=1 Tax=Culex pipiens TaxID=7175 RepID=A0A8D8E820_CULPI
MCETRFATNVGQTYDGDLSHASTTVESDQNQVSVPSILRAWTTLLYSLAAIRAAHSSSLARVTFFKPAGRDFAANRQILTRPDGSTERTYMHAPYAASDASANTWNSTCAGFSTNAHLSTAILANSGSCWWNSVHCVASAGANGSSHPCVATHSSCIRILAHDITGAVIPLGSHSWAIIE